MGYSIPSLVWFEQLLDPMKKTFFLKFVIRKIHKFPNEKLTFFLGKLYQKLFLFYTLGTHGILNAEFGSIWITSWPSQKQP